MKKILVLLAVLLAIAVSCKTADVQAPLDTGSGEEIVFSQETAAADVVISGDESSLSEELDAPEVQNDVSENVSSEETPAEEIPSSAVPSEITSVIPEDASAVDSPALSSEQETVDEEKSLEVPGDEELSSEGVSGSEPSTDVVPSDSDQLTAETEEPAVSESAEVTQLTSSIEDAAVSEDMASEEVAFVESADSSVVVEQAVVVPEETVLSLPEEPEVSELTVEADVEPAMASEAPSEDSPEVSAEDKPVNYVVAPIPVPEPAVAGPVEDTASPAEEPSVPKESSSLQNKEEFSFAGLLNGIVSFVEKNTFLSVSLFVCVFGIVLLIVAICTPSRKKGKANSSMHLNNEEEDENRIKEEAKVSFDTNDEFLKSLLGDN